MLIFPHFQPLFPSTIILKYRTSRKNLYGFFMFGVHSSYTPHCYCFYISFDLFRSYISMNLLSEKPPPPISCLGQRRGLGISKDIKLWGAGSSSFCVYIQKTRSCWVKKRKPPIGRQPLDSFTPTPPFPFSSLHQRVYGGSRICRRDHLYLYRKYVLINLLCVCIKLHIFFGVCLLNCT